MIRVFLDTNILVSASFWKGSSYLITMKIIGGEILGFTTNEILQEYRIVLKRDFDLTEEEIDKRVEKLLEFLEIVSPIESLDIIKDYPPDNKVLEGAMEARVDYIVTYDAKHLLKLKEFKGIKFVPPEEFLRISNK